MSTVKLRANICPEKMCATTNRVYPLICERDDDGNIVEPEGPTSLTIDNTGSPLRINTPILTSDIEYVPAQNVLTHILQEEIIFPELCHLTGLDLSYEILGRPNVSPYYVFGAYYEKVSGSMLPLCGFNGAKITGDFVGDIIEYYPEISGEITSDSDIDYEVTDWKYSREVWDTPRRLYAPWSNLANVQYSDNLRASCVINSGEVSNWLRFFNFGFTIDDLPNGAIIKGVEIEIERKADYAEYFFDDALFLYKTTERIGVNRGTNSTWNKREETVSHGGEHDKWGSVLEIDDIRNNRGFGFDLSVKNRGALTGNVEIDMVRMRIFYTLFPEDEEEISYDFDNSEAPSEGDPGLTPGERIFLKLRTVNTEVYHTVKSIYFKTCLLTGGFITEVVGDYGDTDITYNVMVEGVIHTGIVPSDFKEYVVGEWVCIMKPTASGASDCNREEGCNGGSYADYDDGGNTGIIIPLNLINGGP